MLDKCAEMGVKVILMENASRFAGDVVVQETGLRMLRGCGVSVIPVDAPDYFQDDPNNPTQTLIRQILVLRFLAPRSFTTVLCLSNWATAPDRSPVSVR
jgi:hypothetical protein